MRATTRTVICVGLAVGLGMLSLATAAASNPIQPGDQVNGLCTLNFVFDSNVDDSVYIGTAGHCIDVGDSASTDGHANFGVAVYDNPYGDGDGIDFALIEVDAAHAGAVSGAVAGHPQTPTGFTTSDQTEPGDRLWISGYGIGVQATEPTREQRPSFLLDDDPKQYRSNGPVVNGDSGAPFVHAETGAALGVVSHYNFDVPPSTDEGPTVEGILADLHANGWDVSLRTV